MSSAVASRTDTGHRVPSGPLANAEFEPVIGVEVHVQLATKTKMFCGCRVQYGAAPNTLTCPVCEGLPGSLPFVNKQAVEFAIRIGLALGCQVSHRTKFDRKHYFYPDLPKGYQISQYDQPICFDGVLELPINDAATGQPRRVHVQRAHMEEDSGKSIHMDHCSLVDLNRAGTPLVEIVSGPDMHSPEEAHAYLTALKRNLSYLGVSPLNMEKGSLRCDLNVSLRVKGTTGLPNYKVEVKNLNSFSNAKQAIAHEIERQAAVLRAGGTPPVETRLWDAEKSVTRAMRSKELANDYRYFPEPDLPQLSIATAWVDAVRAGLPEMPVARYARFVSQYALKADDAAALVDDLAMADFFELTVKLAQATKAGKDAPRKAAAWLLGEVHRAMNSSGHHLKDLGVTPELVTEVIALEAEGLLNNITAKEVFGAVLEAGCKETARAAAERLGKLFLGDDGAVDTAIAETCAEFDKAVAEYKGGKTQTMGFLVGQVMRKLKGKANPKELGERIAKHLG